MESYHPQIGELELVLVEDNNDFYDPLEINFEYDDENEDLKLQLNDTVDDNSEFHLTNTDDSNGNSSPIIYDIPDGFIEQEAIHHNNEEEKKTIDRGKIEDLNENSNGSFGAGVFRDDSLDNYSDTAIKLNGINGTKPECGKFNEIFDEDDKSTFSLRKHKVNSNEKEPNVGRDKTDEKQDQRDVKLEREDAKNKTEVPKLETKLSKTKGMKTKPKPKSAEKRKAKSSTSKCDIEKEKITKNDPKNGIDVNESSESKPTRHYSKRNEIPKQVVHMEAYDKKLLFCKICNVQFEKSPVFTDHMRTKHSIDKPFECYICSKPYRICSLLAEHIRYHFNEKPYHCKFCERSFSQLQPYKAHVRKYHTKERPYKCNFVDENNIKCEETFFDTKTYKFHLREHTGDHPFTCSFCSKKFNHSGTYQAHMRIHTQEKPYQCVTCGKSFAQISTHKAHMLTHSDEYRFPCTLCEKKFKQATNLKLHMRVHTKETPYKCEDCGRGFAQLVTYRNHRRIHTGEKPFKCTYTDCGKAFRHRNSYRRHLQTHTGEKPFECAICFKRLSQTSSYVSHMRRHEKMNKS